MIPALSTLTGHFQRWSQRQCRRIVAMLAQSATSAIGIPTAGPTPGAKPMNGATNGKNT